MDRRRMLLTTSALAIAATASQSLGAPEIAEAAVLNQPLINTAQNPQYNIGIGDRSLAKDKSAVVHSVAIGNGAMSESIARSSRYNVAIGLDALKNIGAEGMKTNDFRNGSRNIAVGANTSRFAKEAFNTVAIGRNVLQNNVEGFNVTAVGCQALGGQATMHVETGEIDLQYPIRPNNTTAIGTMALSVSTGYDNTAVGSYNLYNMKQGSKNTSVGYLAFSNIGSDLGFNGNKKVSVNWKNLSIEIKGDMARLSVPNTKGIENGFMFNIIPGNGKEVQQWNVERVEGPNTVYLKVPGASSKFYFSASNASVDYYTTNEAGRESEYNVALGWRAAGLLDTGKPATDLRNSVSIGAYSRSHGDNTVTLGNPEHTVFTYRPLQIRSDKRDKTNIEEIGGEDSLSFVESLKPVKYNLNPRNSKIEDDKVSIGFIAQDVSVVSEKYFGEKQSLVAHNFPEAAIDNKDSYTISYESLIPLLTGAIKELSDKVNELQEELRDLKSNRDS